MTSEQNRVRQEFRNLGYILPEWILGQNPKLINEGGNEFIVVDGGAAFEADQFRVESVMQRYELIQRFSN